LRQSWLDPRLAFQPSGSVPSQIRLFDWDKIWVPDTFFRLETYSFVHQQTVPNKFLRLKNTGELWYVMKYVSSLYCFYSVISIQYRWDDSDVIYSVHKSHRRHVGGILCWSSATSSTYVCLQTVVRETIHGLQTNLDVRVF